MKQNTAKPKCRVNMRNYRKSIDERPEIVGLRTEEGHWERDTDVGKRSSKEAVILTLLEKKTENYLAIRISSKSSETVLEPMQALRAKYGERFSQFLKPLPQITAVSSPTSPG